MSTPLLMLATFCYVLTAFDLGIRQGNAPLSLTFAAYALANFGLMWSIIRG
jgi:hypothetical protein